MLSDADVERYARQIVLPEIGGRGQARLLASRVQVLGHGPASLHAADLLRRAGVQLSDTEPSVVVDLRLDAPTPGPPAGAPLVIGRMRATRAMVDALPAGTMPALDGDIERDEGPGADTALHACALRALGALVASETLVLLLQPERSPRRTTLDVLRGRFASRALEAPA